MNRLIMTSTLMVGAIIMAGCSSNPSPADYALMDLEAAKIKRAAEEKREAEKNEEVSERIADIPDWVFTPPGSGPLGIYSVGSASADDPVVALQKARLKAEFSLAQAVRQEVSGQERQIESESISGGISGEYELLVDRFVSAVPLRGHTLVDQVVYPQGAQAQAHVLYRMSAEALQTALSDQDESLKAMTSTAMFEALEERVREATGGEAQD